jgi:hypothetical protein
MNNALRAELAPSIARAIACLAACALALPACSEQGAAQTAQPAPGQPIALTIVGYNYTDRYIDSFTVNGQGGGNLFLSTPTTGGGKGACCVTWTPGGQLPKKVIVRWVGAYCKDRRTNSAGETHDWTVPIWRQAVAELNGPIPANPGAFEVHIYKDAHVEVAITEFESPPRLALPEENFRRPGIPTYNDPPCTDEQRPAN